MAKNRLIAFAAAAALAVLTPLAAMTPANGAVRPEGAVQAAPPPPAELTSVSCPRADFCMAVGDRADGHADLAEQWKGKHWRVLATPTLTGPKGRSGLVGISCASASQCVAVGWKSSIDLREAVSIAERWNGVRWRLLDVHFPTAWSVRGASCLRRACMIVGQRQEPGGFSVPLAALLTGTRLRALRPAIPPREHFGGFFSAASCLSASFCAAVGGYVIENVGTVSLAETWDGRTWRVRRTWHPATFDTLLDAVSCASPQLCMAGGAPVAGLRRGMTIELLWKDGRWHRVQAARPIVGPPDVPSGFSCPTVTRCVGSEYGLNSAHSAALTWNGGRTLGVHRVRRPAIGALTSISCPRPARCVAVGGFAKGAGTRNGVFAELWNGRRWFQMS